MQKSKQNVLIIVNFALLQTMKRTLPLIFMLLFVCSLAKGQYISTNFQATLVPKYMVAGTSTRLPVVVKIRVTNLKPNGMYKYVPKVLAFTDITSSAISAGAGNVITMDTIGSWKVIGTPSLSAASGHDTLYADGTGNYEGWIGFTNTGNSRFTAGRFIYPGIYLAGSGAGDTFRMVSRTDSIKILNFDTANNANSGTGIWGSSQAKPKNIVALYDQATGGFDGPLAMTYVEDEKLTVASLVDYYTNNVNGKNGNWGTIIPNQLINGVRRITHFDYKTADEVYSNSDADGIWGPNNKNTTSPRGGRTTVIAFDSDDAPLIAPVIEFWARNSSTTEDAGTVNVFVTRKWSNSSSQSVRLSVVGNTATKGTDYTITEPKTITFPAGKAATDTTKITITDDGNAEGDETIVLRLDQANNTTIGTEVAHTMTIKDNDVARLTFGALNISVKEDIGKAGINVKLDKPVSTPVKALLRVVRKGDTTFIPQEFKMSANSNTDTVFNIGKTGSKDSIVIFSNVIDDFIADPNDSVWIVLRLISGNAIVDKDSIALLVIRDNDGPWVIKFVTKTLSVNENAGSFNAQIQVVSKTDATADFTLGYRSGGSTAQESLDFNYNPASQILSLDNTTPSVINVNIPIIDDNVFEGNERILFRINNLSNTIIQKPDSLIVTIVDNDLPLYQIGKINKQTNANRTPDSLNVRCKTTGVVHGVNVRTTGLSFNIQDNSGGINVFTNPKTFGYTVQEGDSVLIQGRVEQFNGLVQMGSLDTIIRLSSNKSLQTSTVVTDLNETTESRLVTMRRMRLVNATEWPSAALSPNTLRTVRIQNVAGKIDTLIIDAETNVDGNPAPTGYFDVTGIGGQFDNSSPFTIGYQIAPRRITDIVESQLPTINFQKTKDTVTEIADSASYILRVTNPDENFTVNVVVKSGTAQSPTDYDIISSRTVSAIKGRSLYQFRFNISDDNVSDGDKQLVLVMRSVNGPGRIGTDSTFTLLIRDNEANSTRKIATGSISVVPNPSQGRMVIKAESELKSAEILSLNGKLLWNQALVGKNAVINSNLSAGIYLLRITNKYGEEYAQQIVVK